MKYEIQNRLPTLAEYRQLCESVGWGHIMNFDVAKDALRQSVFGIVALDEIGRAVAMGRVVGDGAIYFYIQDIVVAPEHQRSGLGTAVLSELFEYIKHTAPEKSFIGLFSVPDAIDFYQKFTLEKRDLVGLFTVKELIVSQ
jgi:ribosomal protein S18 acetylase RimI-like enzyme